MRIEKGQKLKNKDRKRLEIQEEIHKGAEN